MMNGSPLRSATRMVSFLGTASLFLRPVETPDAYFPGCQSRCGELVYARGYPPGKDDDGRRDGPRLKAPSQVLTRATRTASVLHVGSAPARRSSLPLRRLRSHRPPPPSTFCTPPSVRRPVRPSDVVLLLAADVPRRPRARVCRALS